MDCHKKNSTKLIHCICDVFIPLCNHKLLNSFLAYIVIYFNYTLVSCNNFLAYNSIRIVFMIIMEFTFTVHLLEFMFCFVFSCKCIPTTWVKQINIQQLAVTIHGQRDSHRQVGLACMFTAMLFRCCVRCAAVICDIRWAKTFPKLSFSLRQSRKERMDNKHPSRHWKRFLAKF